MTKRFCLQINERQYRDEAMKITNTELMKLYASVMMQPDGPVKQQFLDKVFINLFSRRWFWNRLHSSKHNGWSDLTMRIKQ